MALRAMGFLRLYRRYMSGFHDVIPLFQRGQVCRITTEGIPLRTSVMYFQIVRDSPVGQGKRNPMRSQCCTVVQAGYCELPVSVPVRFTLPVPTFIRTTTIHPGPEPRDLSFR